MNNRVMKWQISSEISAWGVRDFTKLRGPSLQTYMVLWGIMGKLAIPLKTFITTATCTAMLLSLIPVLTGSFFTFALAELLGTASRLSQLRSANLLWWNRTAGSEGFGMWNKPPPKASLRRVLESGMEFQALMSHGEDSWIDTTPSLWEFFGWSRHIGCRNKILLS